MKCPECQGPLQERAQQCPGCGFSLGAIGKKFGELPLLDAKVTDLTDSLPRKPLSRLRQECQSFRRLFPQLRYSVIFDQPPAGRPFAAHCFWLFNSAGLCSELEKGGLNYHLLLVVDVGQRRAHLSVGYGLEPFVSEGHLRDMIEAGRLELLADRPVEAALAILARSEKVLHQIAEGIPRAFGLDPEELRLGP